jgi:hypothetical protein
MVKVTLHNGSRSPDWRAAHAARATLDYMNDGEPQENLGRALTKLDSRLAVDGFLPDEVDASPSEPSRFDLSLA